MCVHNLKVNELVVDIDYVLILNMYKYIYIDGLRKRSDVSGNDIET